MKAGGTSPLQGAPSPGQVVLFYVREGGEARLYMSCEWASKQCSSVVSASSSCPGIPQWLVVIWSPFLYLVSLGQCFISVTVRKQEHRGIPRQNLVKMGCSLSLCPLLISLLSMWRRSEKMKNSASGFQGQKKGNLFFWLVVWVPLILISWPKEASSLALCDTEMDKGMCVSHRPSLEVLGAAYCEQNKDRYLCFYTRAI